MAKGLALLAALCMISPPGLADPVLDSVRVEIQALSPNEFDVRTRFHFTEPFQHRNEPLIHTALLDADQRIDSLVTSVDGVPVEATTRRESHTFRLLLIGLDSKAGHYEVSYRVTSPRALLRVPILVPEFAATRPQTVHISLSIPKGFALAESFPRVTPTQGAWRAVLSNVPSFVLVRLHAGELALSDRVLTAESFTNALIVGLLVTFTFYWLWSRRKRIA